MITIIERKDGFINATKLCKLANKNFNDWYKTKSIKSLIDSLKDETNIIFSKFVDIKKGGNINFQESWIHPKLALSLILWLFPKFSLKINLKENNFLDFEIQIEPEKYNYYQFEKGCVFYIIQVYDNIYKINFEKKDINKKLQIERQKTPFIGVKYLAYTDNASFLKQNIYSRFKIRNQSGEIHMTYNDLLHIIETANLLIYFFNYEAKILTKIDLDKYNKMKYLKEL